MRATGAAALSERGAGDWDPEIGWSLLTKPYAPKAWFYVVFKFDLDPAWMPYLPAM